MTTIPTTTTGDKESVFRLTDGRVGPDYKCSKCSGSNRRLWRSTYVMLVNVELLCASCGEVQEAAYIEKHKHLREPGDINIGQLAPARPTPEGDNFWTTGAGDWAWWQKLTQYPDDPARESLVIRNERDNCAARCDYLTKLWLDENRAHTETVRELDDAQRMLKLVGVPESASATTSVPSGTTLPARTFKHVATANDSRFKTTDYVVDATGAEQFDIWWKWHHMYGLPYDGRQDRSGYHFEIGKVADRPVCVSVSWEIYAGMRVAFIDGVSQLVDHEMIEAWTHEVFPCLKKSRRHSDAMNFGNIVGDIRSRLEAKGGGIALRDPIAVEQAAHKVPLRED